MSIINLQGITKIYRTREVETVALENVNLEVEKAIFCLSWDRRDAEKVQCSTSWDCLTLQPPEK